MATFSNCSAIATSVACLITSNLSRAKAPGIVPLKKGEAGLRKASVVNVCTGKLSGSAAGAVRGGLHLLFERL